jgi:hypothetical protein
MDGKLRLIDFDAFATIVEGGEDGEGYACAKFSSGVLPPEALYQLKGEEQSQFDAYWEDLKTKDTDLWTKVQPKVGKQGKQYVVKTFRAGDNGNPIFDGLPYELLPASASLDIWSLGVMLYLLLTGENLVPVTRDDDFVSGIGMGYVFDWNDEKRREKLSKVKNDPAANDLLSQLLSPDPTKRSENSLQQLLDEHSFFNFKPGDTKMQEKLDAIQEGISKVQKKQTTLLLALKDLSLENKSELRRTREVLMKGIFEATEVHMPTTFIVLNKKLPDPPSEEEKEQLLQIAEDGSGVTVSGELASVTFTEDGLSVEAAGKCKEYVDSFNTGMKWVNRLKTIGTNVAAGKVGDAFKTIKEGLGDLVTGETMYLYLVDELTCEPVRAEGYPIEITKPSEIVHKLLPMMQVGLRAMAIYNGAGGIARLFGYPVPKVPETWATGARESVELLKQESSVAQFGVVHEEVMAGHEEGSEESKSVRGLSLRVFTDFLEKNDPGLTANTSGHFAGLQRIGDPNDGTALWTTLTDPQEVKSALAARAREREVELHDGNMYFQLAIESFAREGKPEAELRDGNKYIKEQAAGGLARQAGELEAVALRASKAEAEAKAAVAKVTDAEAARDEAEKARGESEVSAVCVLP